LTKRDTIVEMLKRYREAQETLNQGNDPGNGGVTLMPATWNHSFRELERCLHVLSGDRHLLARFVDPIISRRRLIGKRTKDGEVVFANVPHHAEVRSYAKLPDKDRAVNEWDVVLATWPGWVKNQLVAGALDALESEFKSEPFLPKEMFEPVAA
jgi:hypothetical protein